NMKALLILRSLAALGIVSNAYKLSLHGGLSCRGQFLGTREMKADSGCQRDFAGNGASVSIALDEGNKDFGNVVIFFEGDDCKPSNIMQNGAG
ncbi:hypothetical protein CC86DRAFT_255339, partial [Ophiobolus disseminans]